MNKTLWICLVAIGASLSGCGNSDSSHNMAPESIAARKVAAIKNAVDQAMQAQHADAATRQSVVAHSKAVINKTDKEFALLLDHADKKQRWANMMQKEAEQARKALLQAALERTRLARLLAEQETIVARARQQADRRQQIARDAMLENLKAQKLLAEVRSAQHMAALTIGLPEAEHQAVQLAENTVTEPAQRTRPAKTEPSHKAKVRPAPSSASTTVTQVAAESRPSASLGNAEHGQKLAQKCQLCHAFEPGKKGRFGPNLYAIIGQPAGKAPGFRYSHALARADFTWNEEQLMAFICHSGKAIKALTADNSATTKMPPQHTCGQDARDVVAYLRNLKMEAANSSAQAGSSS